MITAACHGCGRKIPCESSWVANYIMMNQVKCDYCRGD